ncbi:MAG: ATP-binding protein [Bryobacteraceae bacterium]
MQAKKEPPWFIVIAGPACSGKSTLAAELARRLHLPHLAMDAVRRRLLPDAAHTRADRRVAYRAMHWAAELLLRAGAGVILDAPYGHPEDRKELAQVSASTGVPAKLIECRVSPPVAIARFRQRGADAVRLDLNEKRVERLVRENSYTNSGLVLDTDTLSPAACLLQAESWLPII